MKRTFTFFLLAALALVIGIGCAPQDAGPKPSEGLSSRNDGKSKVDVANLKGGGIYQ